MNKTQIDNIRLDQRLNPGTSSKSSLLFLLLAVLGMACAPTKHVKQGKRFISPDRVRDLYSGERAFDTVAFLDQYVRWPGNRGFDASIDHIAEQLENAGFVKESLAKSSDRLTYRVEEYPMDRSAWEPLDAMVSIVGEEIPVLAFETNRNMLATGSWSTDTRGMTAELIHAGSGSPEELDKLDIAGKIVMAEGSLSRLFRNAVQERSALGVLAYSLPDYLQPEKNIHSIQFRSIPIDSSAQSWGIALSFDAHRRLKEAVESAPVRLHVATKVEWTNPAIERTVVADIRGSSHPDERFVFSAHVQEPGANDNASGVGAQVEMARVAAGAVQAGEVDPKRSITFVWGQEIRSTARYIEQDSTRAKGILWGMSLDMVGEDTDKTGGTFLIEKMPDPSAIWTRGDESHTEWGGRPLSKEDMTPHYFNDITLGRALEQAATNNWVVKTNPFEGGSDHVPFLRSGIPGLLLWHFTDQFYHTDGDRLDMVSADELKNVGVTALNTAFLMVSANNSVAINLVKEVEDAALKRLEREYLLSVEAIKSGASVDGEMDILETWADWYDKTLSSMIDVEVGGASEGTLSAIRGARERVAAMYRRQSDFLQQD